MQVSGETTFTVRFTMPADEAREILGHLEDDIEKFDQDDEYLQTTRGQLILEFTDKLQKMLPKREVYT